MHFIMDKLLGLSITAQLNFKDWLVNGAIVSILTIILLIIFARYLKYRKLYRRSLNNIQQLEERIAEQNEIISSMAQIGRISYISSSLENMQLLYSNFSNSNFNNGDSVNMLPEDRERFLRQCHMLLSGEKNYFHDRFSLLINGKRCTHLRSGRIFRNQHSDQKKFILTVMDITDWEQQNNEIAYAESLLSAIFENLPGPIFLKSVSSEFKYERCNPAYSGLLQKNPADLVGKNDFELFERPLASRIRNCDLGVARTRNIADNRWFFTTPDGKEHAMRFISRLLKHSDGSESILGFGVDVTRQEQIAGKLRRRNKELRLLLSQQPHASMLLDTELNLVCATPPLQDIILQRELESTPVCREICACNITDKAECAACGALEHHSRFICRRARLGENQQLSITPLENETGAVIYLAANIIDDSGANDSGNANER